MAVRRQLRGPLSSLVAPPRGWFQRRRDKRSATGRAEALQRLREVSLGDLARTLLTDAGASAERAIRTVLAENGAGQQLRGGGHDGEDDGGTRRTSRPAVPRVARGRRREDHRADLRGPMAGIEISQLSKWRRSASTAP